MCIIQISEYYSFQQLPRVTHLNERNGLGNSLKLHMTRNNTANKNIIFRNNHEDILTNGN